MIKKNDIPNHLFYEDDIINHGLVLTRRGGKTDFHFFKFGSCAKIQNFLGRFYNTCINLSESEKCQKNN